MERDVVVVGGGVVGLSFAWQASQAGRRVTLIERDTSASGASTRNFGMIWPVGQPFGVLRRRAERSRDLWLRFGSEARFPVGTCGSLHLARHDDEVSVLSEFAVLAAGHGRPVEILDASEVARRVPIVRSDGLVAGMWSDAELVVDPRVAVAALTGWMAEQHGVEVINRTAVVGADAGRVTLADGTRIESRIVVVCTGDDLRTLLPGVLANAGLRRCKLQMQRTVAQPGHLRVGPHLAGGLTLVHYAAFAGCASLPRLRSRLDRELAEHRRFGIHVMMSQNAAGECVIGDSHEYDDDISQFDSARIDELVRGYLRLMVDLPDSRIASRWSGTYAFSRSGAHTAVRVDDRTVVVTGMGGAGMTLSPALAEELWPVVADGGDVRAVDAGDGAVPTVTAGAR